MRAGHQDAHSALLDKYDDRRIVRGLTLSENRFLPTGSMHIVDLGSEAEAISFVYEEPDARAGDFDDIIIRRWTNALERTMQDFESDDREPRFLFLAKGREDADKTARRNKLLEAHRAYICLLYTSDAADDLRV